MRIENVEVINLSKSLPLPQYETDLAAGMDVRACFDCDAPVKFYLPRDSKLIDIPVDEGTILELAPGERILIPTGLKVAIPADYEVSVRPRSGIALKNGITVLNTPGTIDADYRGIIGIIIINLGTDIFTIKHGDKIAQILLKDSPRINWVPVDELSNTERGEGGFGHTSTK